MLLIYRMKRQGRLIHPELTQPAYLDSRGVIKFYGLCKTGSLGAFDCRGGHRSIRYRSLWQRRGRLRLLALFAKVPGYSFNEAGQLQERAMLGSKLKLLVPHQSVHAYFL